MIDTSVGAKNTETSLGMIYSKAIDGGLAKTEKTLEESVGEFIEMPLLHEPGEKYLYSLNTNVLGYLIEVTSG